MEIKNVWSLSLYTSQSSKEQAWPEALLLHCMYILRWWRSLSYSLSLSTLYRHTSQNEMVKTIVISIVGEMCTRQRRWSYLSKENISIMQCDQTFISWCSKENFITIIITDIMTYLRCKTNLTRTKQSLRNNEIRYLIGNWIHYKYRNLTTPNRSIDTNSNFRLLETWSKHWHG